MAGLSPVPETEPEDALREDGAVTLDAGVGGEAAGRCGEPLARRRGEARPALLPLRARGATVPGMRERDGLALGRRGILRRRVGRRGVLRALAGAGALAFVGCSDDEAEPAAGDVEAAGQAEPVAEEPPARRRAPGGVLRLADDLAALDALDLRQATTPAAERWLGGLVHAPLLRWRNAATDELEPALAESLPELPEPGLALYTLAAGARFDPRPPTNGRRVGAEDVIATIASQQGAASFDVPRGKALQPFTVEPGEGGTVRISSATQPGRLLDLFAQPWLGILPQEALDSPPDSPLALRGAGPFRLVAEDAQRWSALRDAAAGRLAALTVEKMTAGAAGEAWREGRLDLLERVLPAAAEGWARPDDPVPVRGRPAPWHLFLRHGRPPWDDPRRRRALHLALDRAALAQAWYGGDARGSSFIPQAHTARAMPRETLEDLEGYRNFGGDLRGARALWAVAGSIETIRISVRAADEERFAPGATLAAQIREALGIDVEIDARPDADLVAAIVDGFVDCVLDVVAPSPDVVEYTLPRYRVDGPLNLYAFADNDVETALNALLVTADRAARTAAIGTLDVLLLEKLPSIPLIYPRVADVVRAGLSGRRPDIVDNPWQYAEMENPPPG